MIVSGRHIYVVVILRKKLPSRLYLMSCVMRKAKTKAQVSCAVTDHAFVFATYSRK